MLTVYYANITKLLNKKKYQEIYQLVPSFRQKRTNKYIHEIDKARSIGAFYLLIKLLNDNHIKYTDKSFKVDKNGKPYLVNNPVYFNFAHSGDYVIAAISNQPVGVDVELIKNKVDKKVLNYVFSEKDKKEYCEHEDKKTFFYLTWCKKESYIKYTGKGLSTGLTNIDLKRLNKMFKTFIKHNHIFSICSPNKSITKIKNVVL